MSARYQILDRLATTAGSSLYRAQSVPDGAAVLVQLLEPDTTGPAQGARFRREYELLRTLDVPGIVKPLALLEAPGRLTMVLESVAGESLDTVLTQRRLDLGTGLQLAQSLAKILAGLHAAHLIHRDLRPANWLVNVEEGRAWLVDASLASFDTPNTVPANQPLLGDWAYLSPEQTGRMNRPVDARADFYSLGVLVYRMLTGQLPFQASDPLEWVHCHVARVPSPPCDLAPEVPQPVSDLVMKLLAKRPEDRYQSAQGLLVDLDRCLGQWQACGRIEPFPLGVQDFPERFRIPHKLYGRDTELATLLAAFDRLAATGQAALVTVSGYSGVGKSALVHELHQPIVGQRGYFIGGKFDQYRHDIPYATLTQAFGELLRQILTESEARIAGWRQQIQAAVGVNGQLIVDVLPQVELVIGPQAALPALPPAEAQNRFRRVFQQFLAVFTRPEHPLVLFVDDLQWIDAASLQLIEHLLTDVDTRYLLLIAAYRDNEVDAAHPLLASLDAIRRGGTPVTDIKLAPLGIEPLNQLMADTLQVDHASGEPLTRLIFERTEGNPFFFTQFLEALHQEGALRRNAQHRRWQWNLDQIKVKDFADNVADLMAGKLRRLPESAQNALQQAACLGNKFDLRRLAQVGGIAEAEVEQRIAPAAREGLVAGIDGSFKFLHDRIQQVAYSLIPEEEREAMHLRIGRVLLTQLSADELSESLFDVANQFNRGAALLSDRDEKAQLAELNLRAGRKAKASAAYASARVYLGAGMALLDESDWEHRYPLTFGLGIERAECEFLSGQLDAAEGQLATLLRHAASAVDQAAVYRLKVQLHVVKSENPLAVDCALACLRLFGLDLPTHPTQEQVEAEYETVWRNVGGRPIGSLIELPPMTDPQMQAATQGLSLLLHPAAHTDRKLFFLSVCHLVNLSGKHGISGASAHGYAWFGMMLGNFGRYAEGYGFSKLARDLVEKHGYIAYQAKVYYAMGLATVWTEPITAALDCMRAAIRAGVETGDLSMACYNSNHILYCLLLRGDPLDAVWRESEKALDLARQARFRDVADMIVSHQRFIASLQGRTASLSSFGDADFDEVAFEAQLGRDRITALLNRYWIIKLQARFLSGDYAEALACARKVEMLPWGMTANVMSMLHYHYYYGLTVAAVYDEGAPDQQREWREVLAAHHDQLREWAEHCSPTFRDKHALVSAEIARIEGRGLDAEQLYEQAIRSAHDNGFVHNEGIAHERAAEFYLARGLTTSGKAHLQEARGCYTRWGADGKVRQLDARHPLWLKPPGRAAAAPPGGAAQLDILSVAKASQAISGRIVLDQLVDTLLRIVIESAGAQSGTLLLARGDELTLAAEASVEARTVQVQLHHGPSALESILPTAILNYVRRSREQVLLADAAQPNPFTADPYFADHRPKSVLCLPILRQSALIGLLYLENNLVPHAFTPDRLSVLDLLAAQAAISLENALLYADLQQENRERQRAEAALREREARIRRLVESNIIGIAFWEPPSKIIEANDAYLQIAGCSRQDLRSGKIVTIGVTAPEYQATQERVRDELRRTGTCTPYETEVLRPDGRRVPVLVGAALLEGSQDHGVAFVLDLTERRQAQTDREARRVAEMANRAKSQFLANMSHELRTPLNGILGYAQILQRDKTVGERTLEGLAVIQQSGEHLLTLINDILDFAKIGAGKLELHAMSLPLPRFLRSLAEIVGVKAEQKHLSFVCELAPELPAAIRVDEGRLRQVLLNLLSNAVKFTDRGEVTLRVGFSPPVSLRFEVQDTGFGIPEGQRETIFQPFEQVGDAQRRLGGTGLGLSISRELVQRMGGTLQLESCVGEGSTFWFELEVPVVEAQSGPPPSEQVVTGYRGPRRKVLVVDDVAANRAVMADLLEPLGFELTEAANGREGLDKAQALRPDLIVMDNVMPEMGGQEATRRLRLLPGLKDVPIIAVSASASEADAQKSLAAGVNAFLPKPINLPSFLSEVAILLQLQWIFERPQQAVPLSPGEPAAPLVAPPAPELEVLHRLARLGNMRDIVRQAARIAELDERYRPFADQLRRLAKGYQSQAILSLVEQVQQGERHHNQKLDDST